MAAVIKTTKSVRFGGHLADVIEEDKNGIHENYNIIIQQIEDPLMRSSHLGELLKQFTHIAHILGKDQKTLVQKLLRIKWALRESEIVEIYLEFLIELVTANPVHQAQVMNCLIMHFVPVSCMIKSNELCVPQEEIFRLIHVTLQKIFTLIPLTRTLVSPLLASNYPFMKKELKAMEWYIKNLLYVTTYTPSLRPQILELIINKALKLDTLCPRDLIKKTFEHDELEEGIFEMEVSHKKDTFVDKLDVVMETLLQFIRDVCISDDQLTQQSYVLFNELICAFDRVILPIHDSSHIQFLMFYICSIKKSFFEAFRDHLWKKVQNPNTPVLVRQTVLSYLGSLLARAKYITLPTALETIGAMLSWIHRYIKQRDGECHLSSGLHETARHGTFYSACQAVFYILIFKHKEILDLPDGFQIMRKMNLEHIIMSRLNPLKYCIDTVVHLFSSVMRQHQIVYCHTIIERNNRLMLPVCGQSEKGSTVNPLDSFFPFDPYLLKTSAHIIDKIYQEWEGSVPQVEEHIKEDENDNELMSFTPISIPGIFDHEKIFSNSFGGKSMSPGFSLINPSPF